jgi:hypothetical protein
MVPRQRHGGLIIKNKKEPTTKINRSPPNILKNMGISLMKPEKPLGSLMEISLFEVEIYNNFYFETLERSCFLWPFVRNGLMNYLIIA